MLSDRLAGRALQNAAVAGRHAQRDEVVLESLDVMEFRRPQRANGLAMPAPLAFPCAVFLETPHQPQVIPFLKVGRTPEFHAIVVVPDVLARGPRQVVHASAADAYDGVAHLNVHQRLDFGNQPQLHHRTSDAPVHGPPPGAGFVGRGARSADPGTGFQVRRRHNRTRRPLRWPLRDRVDTGQRRGYYHPNRSSLHTAVSLPHLVAPAILFAGVLPSAANPHRRQDRRRYSYTPRWFPHNSTCRRGLKRKPSCLQISASHTARSRNRSRSVPSGIRITRLRSASSAPISARTSSRSPGSSITNLS